MIEYFYEAYTVLWISLCLIAAYIWVFRKEPFVFVSKEYQRFLLVPWKVRTFIVGLLFMVLVAPYSGDYTWDYADGFFMTVLTYVTAPWAVGVFFKITRRQASLKQAFLAFCLWMFSASWSYDIYLLFRDGRYPLTWLPNLFASSILYWSAGFFWSLDWKSERGVYYSFANEKWFDCNQGPVFFKILQRGWMFVLLAIIILGGVVVSLNKH